MNGKGPARRNRIWPVDRHTGMARMFVWTGSGYNFRRDGHGAPVPVTDAERNAFLKGGRRSLLIHSAALGLVTWAALLLSERLYPGASSVRHAALTGAITAFVGLILYRSHSWYVDAPARALAGRPAVGPPGQADVTRWPPYGAIVFALVVCVVAIGLHAHMTLVMFVFSSVAATVVALGVAAMKWWFERGFTPKQKQVAAERRAVVKPVTGPTMSIWRTLLLFVFLIVEGLIIIGSLMTVMTLFLSASGSNFDDPAMLPFISGMFLGFALGMLLVWPLEKLCKRWTTTTVADAFKGF